MPAARHAAVTVGNRRAKSVDRAGVEVDAGIPGRGQPGVDGGGDDVAGREVAHRVHAGGDRIALRVKQNRALAAQRLGDQRAPAAGVAVEQHGRVELDELDVADRHARPTAPAPHRHRSSRRGWWWRVQVAEPAGRQDDRRRVHDAGSVLAEHQHAGHRAVRRAGSAARRGCGGCPGWRRRGRVRAAPRRRSRRRRRG